MRRVDGALRLIWNLDPMRGERGPMALETVVIRVARLEDAETIRELIHPLLRYAVPKPDDPIPADFAAHFEVEPLRELIGSANHRYHVALCRQELVGVIGIRDHRHLLHFFVAKSHHGQGIGRRLWWHARSDVLAEVGEIDMSVNSSLYAVSVYRRFGFECVGPVVSGSIEYQPMRLRPGNPRG